MTIKNPTCIDCHCQALHRTTERHGKQLTITEITYSCGARQRETRTTNGNVGTIVFSGCTCE